MRVDHKGRYRDVLQQRAGKSPLCLREPASDAKQTDIGVRWHQNEDQQYWGNVARARGFSEFLYSVDSPNIVRPNEAGEKAVVQTRDFLVKSRPSASDAVRSSATSDADNAWHLCGGFQDGLTTAASVLAIFHGSYN